MRRDLLSIGQLARLKGTSPKALRYYERLGILKPVSIDPESGYRYYSPSQVLDLDVITVALELEMPLKDLRFYRTEGGGFDLERFLHKAQAAAMANLQRSLETLWEVNAYLDELDTSHQSITEEGGRETHRTTNPFRALVVPMPYDSHSGIELKAYHLLMTKLYKAVAANGTVAHPFQGIALLPGKKVPYLMLPHKDVSSNAEAAARNLASSKISEDEQNNCRRALPLRRTSKKLALPDSVREIRFPKMVLRGEIITGSNLGEAFTKALGHPSVTNALLLGHRVIALDVWRSELRNDTASVELLIETSPKDFTTK